MKLFFMITAIMLGTGFTTALCWYLYKNGQIKIADVETPVHQVNFINKNIFNIE